MEEKELYEPMVKWLDKYVKDKYPNYTVNTFDSSQIYLEDALRKINVSYSVINGLQIQIDVLSVAQKGSDLLLFFIEAKKGTLVLKDLGQLYIYSKLAQPAEAFLITPKGFGSVGKVIGIMHKNELLNYGDQIIRKEIKVVQWDTISNSPNWNTKLP